MAAKFTGCIIALILAIVLSDTDGPTTAFAMAVSKGWTKLAGPILLIGTPGRGLTDAGRKVVHKNTGAGDAS